jgi:hypothetical protein
MEGQKICNGPPPKAEIVEIVNFGSLFLVDMMQKDVSNTPCQLFPAKK